MEKFRIFLIRRCCERVVEDRIRYVNKFSFYLFTNDFSVINGFSDCKRGHLLNSLSALSKLLGVYKKFQRLVKAYGLKWRRQNAERLILDRTEKKQE